MEIVAANIEAIATGSDRPAVTSTSAAARRRISTIAYYDRHAEHYAAMTAGFDTIDRIARFAALLPNGGRVLDAGCGAGRDLLRFEAAGLRPEGLDISRALVEIGRRNSGLPVRMGDIRNPPFAPASFDGIWAMASLLHIELDEIRGVLDALRELLVPGGVLFTSVKGGRGLVRDEKGRWFTLHDEVSWSRYLRSSGFEIIEVFAELPVADNSPIATMTPGWISNLARRPV